MNTKQKLLQLIMALVLVAGLLAPAALSVQPAQARIQPQLAALIAEAPDQMVRVIVQKAGAGTEAEHLAASLGGEVLTDLPLINAFAARLSPAAVDRLGASTAVRWVSLDAPVVSTGKPTGDGGNNGGGNKTSPTETPNYPPNFYLDTLGVPALWDMGVNGEGVSVAVVDSGIKPGDDFRLDPNAKYKPNQEVPLRLTKIESFNPISTSSVDAYGHGTHIAGIIGGNGFISGGVYSGIAPMVHLISLKISDGDGLSYESDVVAALQWVFDNKEAYNIRVVNLSIQSTVESSYHESALNIAGEILWLNGVVVVAAVGNKGPGGGFNTTNVAPANDPFFITVGATDEFGNPDRSNDDLASFSAKGMTLDGYIKPDILAPGTDIISILAQGAEDYNWGLQHPDHVVAEYYFRASGTSMATPMVAGTVALLLQAEPNLTPDQVKARLILSSSTVSSYYTPEDGKQVPYDFPYLDAYAAVTTPTSESANQGVIPHMLLAKMAMIAYWSSTNGEETIDWASVDWEAVNWDAVDWNAVNWNAVNWNAVNWNAVNWNAVNWNAVNWNAVNWNAVNWNAVNWNAVNWNAVNWNAVSWGD